MATLTKSDIAVLSVDERLALVDDLYDSFADLQEDFVSPGWHVEILDQILDEDAHHPQPTVAWSELRAEMAAKWLR
jgi:putative addiction module component (TIGR02574 family)